MKPVQPRMFWVGLNGALKVNIVSFFDIVGDQVIAQLEVHFGSIYKNEYKIVL